MRDTVLFILAILIIGGGYGYTKNPKACQKLGTDFVRDVKAIYLPSGSTASGSDETADADGSAPSAAAPAPPAPTHYPMGYVAPVATAPASPAAATPIALPSPAPATNASRFGGPLPSFTDYDEALAAARARHAPLLVLFTGSDWCPYCQKLDQEVLSTSDFQHYVAGHFVFLTVDDLRNTPVSDDAKKQIASLERKFSVGGFPSMLVLDNSEHSLGEVEGYEPGSGPSAVTGKLDELAAKFTN